MIRDHNFTHLTASSTSPITLSTSSITLSTATAVMNMTIPLNDEITTTTTTTTEAEISDYLTIFNISVDNDTSLYSFNKEGDLQKERMWVPLLFLVPTLTGKILSFSWFRQRQAFRWFGLLVLNPLLDLGIRRSWTHGFQAIDAARARPAWDTFCHAMSMSCKHGFKRKTTCKVEGKVRRVCRVRAQYDNG